MPTFPSPEPITVEIDLSMAVGNLRVVAADRTDTVVSVRPGDEARKADVRAAAETRVDYTAGKLLVEFTRTWRHTNPFSRNGSVDVHIELPAGSHLRADIAVGDVACAGRLGEVRVSTHHGEVTIEQAEGPVDIRTDHGHLRVGDVAGDVRLTGVSGGLHVGRAGGDVDARNAKGPIRVAEVARGQVVLTTASGEVEVGIREGTAAWLDARTVSGRLRNSLTSTPSPDATDDRVTIRARTYDGDIVIRRAG